MNKHEFAEDPVADFGDRTIAVRDGLRRRGWRDTSRLSDSQRWITDDLRSAVESLFDGFFAAWHKRSGEGAVRWEAIAKAIGPTHGAVTRLGEPRLDDPQHDLCAMFCLVAGLGGAGRAFDQVSNEAGLPTAGRDDADLRQLAAAIRGVDRERLADREQRGKAGMLFERLVRWPFVAKTEDPDWRGSAFRRDLERYCHLTTLDLSEVADRPTNHSALGEPQCLATWLEVLGLSVVSARLEAALRRVPTVSRRAEILAEAKKLRDALQAWLLARPNGATDFASAGVEFQDQAAKGFAALMDHSIDVPEESAPTYAWFRFQADQPAALRMWFGRAAYEGRIESMPAEVATKWLRLVKQELSSFRPLLGQEDKLSEGWEQRVWSVLVTENPRLAAKTELERALERVGQRRRIADLCQDLNLLTPSERFERDREHFLACIDQVAQIEGLWEGMRQLLLALRALKSPCVASDLRYWEEPDAAAAHHPRQPERPWQCIPATLVALLHANAAEEEVRDPQLKALRSQFAAFCLNGLRDNWNEKQRTEAEASGRKRSNADMVEPSLHWRFCRVRAVKTLAINPDGRGHRVLQAASEMDPEQIVREVANDAYQSLRRGVTLPEGMSPRRAILGAFWWLRQAHLKDLGYPIDRDGAQRTRIKELSRTKEPERN